MLDFDFDVVTGPSQASCPVIPLDPAPAEDRAATEATTPVPSVTGEGPFVLQAHTRQGHTAGRT